MRVSRSDAWRVRLVAPFVSIVVGSAVAHSQQQARVALTGGVARDQRGVSSRAVAM